jgi:uncharacterized membrane protein
MRVRSAALLIPAVLLAIPAAAWGQREVTVQAATVRSLDAKLQAFARGLAPAERAAWGDVLRQAASAPADAASGVQVKPVFYAGGTPATVLARDPAGGIIVQGGRTSVSPRIIVQGGSPAARDNAANPHIIVQGGSPATRAAGVGGGPRSADAVAALDAKLHAFAATLSGDEQATFDWLLQRAAPRVRAGGTPSGGGTATPSLGQALGLIAIGPKQDDPSPPPPENLRVMLRF